MSMFLDNCKADKHQVDINADKRFGFIRWEFKIFFNKILLMT
jgi:hypothetical protein